MGRNLKVNKMVSFLEIFLFVLWVSGWIMVTDQFDRAKPNAGDKEAFYIYFVSLFVWPVLWVIIYLKIKGRK